jgi:hypothetical protein
MNDQQLEQQAKAQWDRDAKAQAEFNGDYETFKAWFIADAKGLIKDFKPNDSTKEHHVKLTSEDLRGRDFRAEAMKLWETDSAAKKDFGGDFETFLCWFEADQKGLVKSLGGAARG